MSDLEIDSKKEELFIIIFHKGEAKRDTEKKESSQLGSTKAKLLLQLARLSSDFVQIRSDLCNSRPRFSHVRLSVFDPYLFYRQTNPFQIQCSLDQVSGLRRQAYRP